MGAQRTAVDWDVLICRAKTMKEVLGRFAQTDGNAGPYDVVRTAMKFVLATTLSMIVSQVVASHGHLGNKVKEVYGSHNDKN